MNEIADKMNENYVINTDMDINSISLSDEEYEAANKMTLHLLNVVISLSKGESSPDYLGVGRITKVEKIDGNLYNITLKLVVIDYPYVRDHIFPLKDKITSIDLIRSQSNSILEMCLHSD